MEDEFDDTATAKPVAFLDSDDLDFGTVFAAPNPFNSKTVLGLRLREAGSVTGRACGFRLRFSLLRHLGLPPAGSD